MAKSDKKTKPKSATEVKADAEAKAGDKKVAVGQSTLDKAFFRMEEVLEVLSQQAGLILDSDEAGPDEILFATSVETLRQNLADMGRGLYGGENPQLIAHKVQNFYGSLQYVLEMCRRICPPYEDLPPEAQAMAAQSFASQSGSEGGAQALEDHLEEGLEGPSLDDLVYDLETLAHSARMMEPLFAARARTAQAVSASKSVH